MEFFNAVVRGYGANQIVVRVDSDEVINTVTRVVVGLIAAPLFPTADTAQWKKTGACTDRMTIPNQCNILAELYKRGHAALELTEKTVVDKNEGIELEVSHSVWKEVRGKRGLNLRYRSWRAPKVRRGL